MIRILGIDPGSQVTGYGLIDAGRGRAVCVTFGCIRPRGGTLAERLHGIQAALEALVDEHRPQEAVVERVYVHRNVESALKLGQARGAALAAVAGCGVPVHEYTPAQIKQAVTGRGNAAKVQVQHMVKALLGLHRSPAADAADALAMALCHGHLRESLARLPAGTRRGRARGRWR